MKTKGTYRMLHTHISADGQKWYIMQVPGLEWTRYLMSYERFWYGYGP